MKAGREEEEQRLLKKAATLIESGIYETVWQREKAAARKRGSAGRPLLLPAALSLPVSGQGGQEWPSQELEPLFYEGRTEGLVLLDIHGGGFVEGTPYADDRLCDWYQERLGCTVVSLDYRKAPLYPYPLPLYDIAAQICWLAEEKPFGLDPRRMVIMGHSAGGNLAAAYCLLAKKEGLPAPCAQVLDYPYLDVRRGSLERPDLPEAIEPLYMEVFRQAYLGTGAAHDPEGGRLSSALHSPVLAAPGEVAGLPPALLVTCGRDSLGPEGERYGEILKAGGVAVTHWHLPEGCHAFIEHTFNVHSRFSIAEDQKRLALEMMPKLAEWIGRIGETVTGEEQVI